MAPMLIGGPFMGGAAAPLLGYWDIVQSTPLVTSNGLTLNNSQRTVTRPAGTVAGDILIAVAANGPNVSGMQSLTLSTPTFQAWSAGGGASLFDPTVNKFVMGIYPRIAVGGSEDDCLIFGSGSPQILHVFKLVGNPYVGAIANISSANQNSRNVSDSTMFREDAFYGGRLHTARIFATAKDNTSDDSVSPVSVDSNVNAIQLLNTTIGGQFNSMILGIAWKPMADSSNVPTGEFTQSGPLTSWRGAVSATFRSGDS